MTSPPAPEPFPAPRREPGPRERRLRRAVRRAIGVACRPWGTITHVATREPVAALTFDDGPDPDTTPRLAELLEAHGARGTFFVVGEQVRRHPQVVERLVAAGHALGNHTWDHPSLPLLGRAARRLQIRRCGAELERFLPAGEPRLLRPPYGHQTFASYLDARLLGYRVVTWNLIAEDFRGDPAQRLVERVLRRFEPGSIALFHDRLATSVDERFRDRGPTLEAVAALLARFAGEVRFVTVPELLRRGRPLAWPWRVRPDLAWLGRAR